MERKLFKAEDLTLDDSGAISFRFAKKGVVDHHGDIIEPNSMETGKEILMSSWNHSSWGPGLPIGKGKIEEDSTHYRLSGMFNLKTTIGREHYETVKFNGNLQEYSFGFDILDSRSDTVDGKQIRRLIKLDTFETSPVLMGAGIDTGTDTIKSKESEGAESKTYHDHAEIVMASVADFVKRSQSIADLRQEDGKEPVSEKNREKLKALSADMRKAADEIDRILSTSEEDDEEIKAIMSFLAAQGEFITGGTI